MSIHVPLMIKLYIGHNVKDKERYKIKLKTLVPYNTMK